MEFCQSCGMPLKNEKDLGTEKGGVKNKKYCVYCYADGRFTKDMTMEEMIAVSLGHMKLIYKDDPSFDEQKALKDMNEFFPGLERWKNKR